MFSIFVNELKSTNPGRYHRTAKKLGGIADKNHGNLVIKCLEQLTQREQVAKDAESCDAMLQQYGPIDLRRKQH